MLYRNCKFGWVPLSQIFLIIYHRETNLKIRQGIPETTNLLTPDAVSGIDAIVKSELPNNSLYTFEGVLKLKGKDYPVGPQQILLRGAQLRNTRWVYAIVVFTGH